MEIHYLTIYQKVCYIQNSKYYFRLIPLFLQKDFLGGWGEYYYQATTVPSAVGSQYLWFSNRVNIHSKVIYFRGFSDKKAIFKKIS